jgi:hypothetical protein
LAMWLKVTLLAIHCLASQGSTSCARNRWVAAAWNHWIWIDKESAMLSYYWKCQSICRED